MTFLKSKKILFLLAELSVCLITINSITLNGCALEKVSSAPSCPRIPNMEVPPIFVPEKDQPKISLEIVKLLKNYHYKHQNLDDRLSERVFKGLIRDLDGNRSYFLKSDIDDFQSVKHCMDDALQQGDLEPAFAVCNRYQRRVIERLEYVNSLIEGGLKNFNYEIEESIEIDRKKSPWLSSSAELDDLWRKRLKNEVINLRLSGKTQDKILEVLGKKYQSQLHRMKQRDSEDVFRAYMNSFAQAFDPHTEYFSPRAYENFDILMKLSLEGIGALLQSKDEYTKIVRLIPAGPADKSGLLKPGDRIVGVGQETDKEIVDVVGWRLDDVVELIRGPKDTVVRLEIIPADAADDTMTKIISLTRNTVKLEEQAAQKKLLELEKNGSLYKIGIIDIPTFYVDFNAYQEGKKDFRSTTRDVGHLLEELIREKVDGIIIDLRENGGGALQEANALTGLFIDKGPIVQVRGENERTQTLMDPYPGIVYGGPLMVMINRMSASASEIFAGAIQDYKRGIVVGTQSFGKGTVQSLEKLEKGQLKITRGKFYRVSGESTQNKGIIPDILFPEIYDKKEIGESSLPNSLVWDSIDKARYKSLPEISATIKRLEKLHQERSKNDPGFKYILAGIEQLNKVRSQKTISLKESTRKKEREEAENIRLELENMRRSIQGEKVLANVSELEEIDDDEIPDPEDKKDKFDPVMTEAEQIFLDYISTSSKMIASG
jgi:carboxyl-terminal processing protease